MVQTEQSRAPSQLADHMNHCWQEKHLDELNKLADRADKFIQSDQQDKKLRLARDVVLESIRQSPLVLLQHQSDSVKALVEASAKHLKDFIESP